MLEKKTEITHIEEVSTSGLELTPNKSEERQRMEEPEVPNLCSVQMIPLLASCALVYLCSTSNGFDGSLMSSIYTQKDFVDYFKTDPEASSSTGLIFSIFNIASICSSLFCPLIDILGRKVMIMVGAFGVIIGTIITTAATNVPTLIGGRFLLNFFAVQANTSGAMYVVEVSIYSHRSRVAGLYNTLWYMGSVIAAFTAYGSDIHHSGTQLAFRLPLGMQGLFPVIVFLFGWFIPESPRWLVGKGKIDKAKDMIAKYHCNGNRNDPLVDFEIAEIMDSFSASGLEDNFKVLDPRPLFKNGNTYRTLLVIAMAWFGQFSGNNVVSYYLPTMMQAIGLTSVSMNILLNALNSITSWISSIVGAFVHERVGRRKMFIFSTLASACALTGLAVATARFQATGAHEASSTSIVFVFLFSVLFSFAFTPMQPIYPAEVSSNSLRSRSQMFLNLTAGVASFINQYATPTAMKNIKYWFYVFYVFFDIFEFVIVYFFFVETKGKSLEEMDLIFEANSPVKVSVGNFSKESEEYMQKLNSKKEQIAAVEHKLHDEETEARGLLV